MENQANKGKTTTGSKQYICDLLLHYQLNITHSHKAMSSLYSSYKNEELIIHKKIS